MLFLVMISLMISILFGFFWEVINNLKKEFISLEDISLFLDGCAAQLKNKHSLSDLCFLNDDFGVDGEWNFFATSHGKGGCCWCWWSSETDGLVIS